MECRLINLAKKFTSILKLSACVMAYLIFKLAGLILAGKYCEQD